MTSNVIYFSNLLFNCFVYSRDIFKIFKYIFSRMRLNMLVTLVKVPAKEVAHQVVILHKDMVIQ